MTEAILQALCCPKVLCRTTGLAYKASHFILIDNRRADIVLESIR